MSLLDHPLITERYFFPRQYAVPDPEWVEVNGARLACHASRRKNPIVVVYFHGNGEVVADYVPDFEDLMHDLGADCFLAEYRGYGESGGTPRLGEMLDDIPAIFEAVGRPPEEIIVFGRSVGSIYAVEFAYRYPEVAGLVLESGIADPLERIRLRVRPHEMGTTEEALERAFRERLDHARKLREREKPTLILHAKNDSLVDASHAARLSSCPVANVRLVLLPLGDHNTVFAANRDRYLQELAQLFKIVRGGASGYESAGIPAAPNLGIDPYTASMLVVGEGVEGARSTLEVRPALGGVRVDASVVGPRHDWAHSATISREDWNQFVDRIQAALEHGPTVFGERVSSGAGRVEVALGGSPPSSYHGVGGKDDHARRVAVEVMRIVAALGGPTNSILLPTEPGAKERRSPDDTLEVGIFDPEATTEYEVPNFHPHRRGPGETREIKIPEELSGIRRKGPGHTIELEQQNRDGDD